MSEQSGPITREQVERAIAAAEHGYMDLWESYFGDDWRDIVPRYVLIAYSDGCNGWETVVAALTRWRDELVAAEPVRRVARWDAELEAYALTPIHDDGALMTHAVEDAAKARDWGYEIEGGPEPVRDWKSDRAIAAIWPIQPAEDSPERLRERRERLGWTTAYAGHWVPWFDHTDVERAESGKGIPAFVARYAAALSAEEARRAAVGAWAAGGGVLHYSRPTEPERPAPRFKVGDRVTSGLGGPWKIGRVEWGRLVPEADCDEWVYHHASGNVSACESVLALAWTPTPASPPAPEVVDVPQPVVKRFGGVEASWGPGRLDVITLEEINGDDEPFDVPIALLRAMLAAIDAQQGGAS